MDGTTNFLLMRQCLNCYHLNDKSNKKCSQCNCMFLYEADELEKKMAQDKQLAMKKRRELKGDKEDAQFERVD